MKIKKIPVCTSETEVYKKETGETRGKKERGKERIRLTSRTGNGALSNSHYRRQGGGGGVRGCYRG